MANPLRYCYIHKARYTRPHQPRLRPEGDLDVASEDDDATMHQRNQPEDGIVYPLKPATPEKPAGKAVPEDGTLSKDSPVKLKDVANKKIAAAAVHRECAFDPGVKRTRRHRKSLTTIMSLEDPDVQVAMDGWV